MPLSAGSAVDRDLKFALDQGWGELDFDVIVRAQEERTGVRLELTPDEIEALTESQQ